MSSDLYGHRRKMYENLGRNTAFPYRGMFPEENHINLQHIQEQCKLLLLGSTYFVAS
jgi:hypothetical protein